MDGPNSDTPYTINTSLRGNLLLTLLSLHRRNPNKAKDLLLNAMFQPFNDASNSFCTQSDRRQGGNLFSAHSLPEAEPENHAVALLVGPGQAIFQVLIDLVQKNSEAIVSWLP